MRVHAASLTSVAPTDEFGEIVTVLTGVARPMREPGISVLDPVPPDPTSGVPDCCIPRFDENPERIVIDSDGLVGTRAVCRSRRMSLIGNVTGPLDFTFGAYKMLPETPPAVGANMSGVPVPAPAADEFTVGGFNIENFAGSDDAEAEGLAGDPAADAVARHDRPHRDPRSADAAGAGRPGEHRRRCRGRAEPGIPGAC